MKAMLETPPSARPRSAIDSLAPSLSEPEPRRPSWRRSVVTLFAALMLVVSGLALYGTVRRGHDSAQNVPAELSVDGVRFEDPQGAYSLTIADDWRSIEPGPLFADVSAWAVGPTSGGFTPNVNVLVQELPAAMDLEDYLELGEANMNLFGDFESLTSGVERGADGGELGVVECRGILEGSDRPAHWFQVIVMSEDGRQAVVVTLTAEEEDFAELRSATEPYMRTVQAG